MSDKSGGYGPGVGSVRDMINRVDSTARQQGAQAGWLKASAELAGAISERDAKIAQHERTIEALQRRVKELEANGE